MARWLKMLVALVMIGVSDRVEAIEVCLVNATDQEVLITLISGSERLEKRVPAGTRVFVELVDGKDDRVVIGQMVQGGASTDVSLMKVVGTQVLRGSMVDQMHFCYVHTVASGEDQMDLLGFRCLDIVPLDWRAVRSREEFGRLRSALITSLRTTEEGLSGSKGVLQQMLRYVPVD